MTTCSNKFSKDVEVFTDGACRNNGKKSATGGIGVFFSKEDAYISQNFNLALKDLLPEVKPLQPTNQKAELLAILKALVVLKDTGIKFNSIVIKTDSDYSIKCLTVWYKNWIRNDWKTSTKKDVLNKEIIKPILDEMSDMPVSFKHVKAHKTEPKKDSEKWNDWNGNNKADVLACAGADYKCFIN